MGVPSSKLMTSILDTLDGALGVGATYVHCVGGRGRTGTVVGCYLVRHAARLMGANDGQDAGTLALARIAELRAAQRVPLAERSPETRAQREFVLGWDRGR
jgi:protein tyrosine phosphatase